MFHQWIWDTLTRNLKVEWALFKNGVELTDAPFELTDGGFGGMDWVVRCQMSDVRCQM